MLDEDSSSPEPSKGANTRLYTDLGCYGYPSWVTIEITTEGDTSKVKVHSKIHVNKTVEAPWCYSSSCYSYRDILDEGDLHNFVISAYG